MFRSRFSLVLCGVVLATAGPGWCADKVPPLSELIQKLKDPDRMKQEEAAEQIYAHYKSEALKAIPAVIESLGHELSRTPGNPTGRACLLLNVLPKLAAEVGQERIKLAFAATEHKDPFVRAGALCLLYRATEEKAVRVDLPELLVAVRRGAKDDDPLVRAQAIQTCRAFQDAEQKLVDQVIPMLIEALGDMAELKKSVLISPAHQAATALHGYKSRAMPAMKALMRTALDERSDMLTVRECCLVLSLMVKDDKKAAEKVLDGLRPLLFDKKRPTYHRSNTLSQISFMGPNAEKVLPDLIAIVQDDNSTPALCWSACQVIKGIGPPAKEAVLPLIARLQRSKDSDEHLGLLGTLGGIGPAANDTIQAIEKWVETIQDERVKRTAARVLKSIRN